MLVDKVAQDDEVAGGQFSSFSCFAFLRRMATILSSAGHGRKCSAPGKKMVAKVMTLEALSRYLLRSRNAAEVRAVKLYRRELALAKLQQLIFVHDTRAYLENSIRSRLAIAYIKEHWAEIMAEVAPVT